MPPFHLPRNLGNADVQVFVGKSDTSNTVWETYQKPIGKSLLYIYCLGAGGGGGGGFTGVATSARGGGGGGGSGAISTALFPLSQLPDTLYLMVPPGGQGGAAGVSGQAANVAYVSLKTNPVEVPTNNLLRSGFNAPGGGGAGTVSTGGAAGTAGTASNIGNMPLAGLGLWNTIAGQAGTAGGAHTGASGGNIALPTTGINVMGGTGGAGTTSADFGGGAITAVAGSLISESRPGSSGLNNGSGGFSLPNLMYHFPGLGGGAQNSGVGRDGGNGGYGCGGGGGGGGTTGGRGGNGGSGLVVMIAW